MNWLRRNIPYPWRIAAGVLVVLLAITALGSAWLVVAAVVENLRFSNEANQILSIVGATRDLAQHQKDFALQPGEDVLKVLGQAGQMIVEPDGDHAKLTNVWDGVAHVSVALPSVIRIEDDVPPRGCRRLALFFLSRGAGDLGIVAMEAGDKNKGWRRFYPGAVAATEADVVAACGNAPFITLAVLFKVR